MKLLLTLLFVISVASCSMAQQYLNPTDSLLCEIGKKDQEIRLVMIENSAITADNFEEFMARKQLMAQNDIENQAVVSTLLDERGWPEDVSKEAHSAIFLIIDHADLDMQKKYFPMMEEQVAKGNVPGRYLAVLHDRILLHEGKRQIYGTQNQLVYDQESDSMRLYTWPVEDAENIDKLREKVGLCSMAEYTAEIKLLGYELITDHGMDPEELVKYANDNSVVVIKEN